MNSKGKIVIEEFEEHEKVTFYTIRFVSEKLNETEDFFSRKYIHKKASEDVAIIAKMLDKIGENGAFERNFRRAGKFKDKVGALPEYLYSSKLRLYAIRLSESIVVLGNGGYKKTRTYNEDPFLENSVHVLQKIDQQLTTQIKKGVIKVDKNKIKGSLNFVI